MRHGLVFVLALLPVGVSVPAQPAPESPEQIYKAAGAKATKPVATVSYGIGPLQSGDLRLPSGKGPFPVAIVIHGGCWLASVDTRAGIAAVADALGKRGFATWNIEYRRIGDAGGGWPGTFEDVAAGVDKLAEIAPRYRLDLTRVTIVGHSAGAHLALWAASRSKLDAPWRSAAVRPVSVVAIDGPASLAPFVGIDREACGRPVIEQLMGGLPARMPAEYRIVSPADHLPLGVRQLSVAADFTPFIRPYVAAARASGDVVEAIEPPKANHFDIVTPGTPNGEAVLDFIAAKAFTGAVTPSGE